MDIQGGKMKIAIDARFYRSSTGGIGRYTRALIRELMKIDKENEYTIFITPDDEKEYELENQKSKIKNQNFKKVVVNIPHYSLGEQTKFLQILNKGKFDLAHFLHFNNPIFYRGKFVVTIHDLTLIMYPSGAKKHSFLKKFAMQPVLSHAVKSSAKIITDSQATKRDIEKMFQINSNKTQVIYLGVDAKYQNAKKLKLDKLRNYKIKQPYLLFISQWRPHKGILDLIKAFEILKEKYKIPHKLVIVGKPNYDFPNIPAAIDNSPYRAEIITPGFVREESLPALYQNADLFVFPSHYEGFGLTPLEAMAAGVPVASSNLSCMPEILGDAAVYFNPSDANKMAEKIYRALQEKPSEKNLMIKKGFEQVKKYSWSKMAKETLQEYYKALE